MRKVAFCYVLVSDFLDVRVYSGNALGLFVVLVEYPKVRNGLVVMVHHTASHAHNHIFKGFVEELDVLLLLLRIFAASCVEVVK